MMGSHVIIFLITVILALTCITPPSATEAQQTVLLADEFKSIQLLAIQYGMAYLPLNNSLCNFTTNGYMPVRCDLITTPTESQVHVTKIDIMLPTYQDIGTLPSMSTFSLPKLKIFSIQGISNVKDPNLQLFNYLSNCTQLENIFVASDPTLVTLDGFNFALLTKLQTLTIRDNPNLISLGNFFNGNTQLQFLDITLNPILRDISFGSTLSLPNLQFLWLKILDPINSLTLSFTNSNFPKLQYLYVSSLPSSNPITIQTNSSTLYSIEVTEFGSTFNFIITNTSAIQFLKLAGLNTTITPNDLGAYNKLKTFELNGVSIGSIQATSLPPTLNNMIIPNENITSIPSTIYFPKLLAILDLSYNRLTTIPYNVFQNVHSMQGFNVANNINLTSPIPPEFCRHKIDIRNTSITQIPDCYWCYPQSMLTDIPTPAGFVCKPTLSTPGPFPSINGIVTITGTNLGWGGPAGIVILSPNFILTYPFTEKTSPKNVTVPLSNTQSIQVPMVVADIDMGVVEVSVQPNKVQVFIAPLNYNPNINHQYYITNDILGIKVNCYATVLIVSNFSCETLSPLNGGTYNLVVENEFNQLTRPISINSPITYPLVSSAQLNGLQLTINGQFGPNNNSQSNSVKLNNTMTCTITEKTNTLLVCSLGASPAPGTASLQVTIDASSISLNNMVSVPFPPSDDLMQQCMDQTNNCNGHGQCNEQGQCICETGYYDDCKYLTNPNTTFVQNDTKPVATFEFNNTRGERSQFSFSLVSVQELDSEDKLVQELLVDKWNVTDQSQDELALTSLHYRLLINGTVYPLLQSVNVTTLIEYSNQSRSVTFGDTLLSIGAGSIKVGVNVTGWKYQTVFSHLRVVFSTVVNNEQTVERCSDQSEIPTFEEILGSDSYLRVIKDGTQFYGRFLSYSYSDGRKTYSRNELINQTEINANESLALIGIHFPQCQECLLDPDFSALVVAKQETEDCPSSSSNAWKIAVGVSVGGAVFIALVIATIFYLKDSNRFRLKLKAAKSIMMKNRS